MYVTKKERWAFYAFSFANQPFLTTFAGLAAPVILESLAAGAAIDTTTNKPCNTSTSYNCKVYFAGSWFDTASFTLYTSALTVALQALVFISIGSIADYGSLRKPMLLVTSIIYSICIILFLVIKSYNLFWLASLLIIISSVCYGSSYVFYYTYLPILTSNTKEVLEASNKSVEDISKLREDVSNLLSGKGYIIGYFGGFLHVMFSTLIIIFYKETGPVNSYTMQIVAAFTGAWVLFFDIIPLLWTRNRKGKQLPEGENYILYSWKQIINTFKHIKQLSNLFIFLLSWFIMSDTYHTVGTAAVLVGKKELQLNETQLAIAAILAPLLAAIGTLVWNFIRSKFKLSTKTILMIVCALYGIVGIYPLIGLIPKSPFGLIYQFEAYIIIGYHGFLIGSIQSFYRVLFSEMIPKGKESEFFSLYQISSKGSSWIGPLVVGAIAQNNSIRLGFIFIFGSTILAVTILSFVNINNGIEQSKQFELLVNDYKIPSEAHD